MLKKLARILLIFLLVVIVVGAIAALTAPAVTRMVAQKSFPQVDGQVQLSGLDGPVDIYRDPSGVPMSHPYPPLNRALPTVYRKKVVITLGKIGPDAKEAVPALTELLRRDVSLEKDSWLEDVEQRLREAVTTALDQIESRDAILPLADQLDTNG